MVNPEIPGYSDLVEVAHGASSVVYRADDVGHSRQVAIKVLKAKALSDEGRLAFERELIVMGQLADHPHVVDLIGSGFSAAGHPYIVMPFYRNGTYGSHVETHGPMAWQDAVEFGVQVASALETAHRRGFVHRDIKPANIYRSEFGGRPLLADFGVSSFVAPSLDGGPTVAVSATPIFSAPEVLNGERPTVLSDIYSLGTTLYGLIEGRAAYSSKTVESVIGKVTGSMPVPLIERNVPDSLRKLVARMMSKNPIRRPPSALDVAKALNTIQAQNSLAVTPALVPSPRTMDGTTDGSHKTPAAAGVSAPITGDNPPVGIDAPAGQSDGRQGREVTPGPVVLQALDTREVHALERPTEPVKTKLSAKSKVTKAPMQRPRLVWAVAIGLLGLIAIVGFTVVTGSDPTTSGSDFQGPLDLGLSQERRWENPAILVASWQAHDGVIGAVDWSSDGDRLTTGGHDRLVHIWQVGVGDTPMHSVRHDDWVLDLSWSDKDTSLAVADAAGNISLWDGDGANPPTPFAAHTGPVEALAWDGTGQRIVSGGDDGQVHVWAIGSSGGVASGERILSFDGHDGAVLTVGWSMGDDRIASGSKDRTATIWSVVNGEPLMTIDGHDEWIRSLDWSPHSPALATAGSDRTIRVWDGRSGDEVRRFESESDPTGPAVWSPSGALIAFGEENGAVRIVDVARDRQLAALDAGSDPPAPVTAIEWSADGKRLAVGRANGLVEIWEPEGE